MKSSAPAYSSHDGVIAAAEKTLGAKVLSSLEAAFEVSFTVARESLVETMLELVCGTGASAEWTGPNEVRVDPQGLSSY